MSNSKFAKSASRSSFEEEPLLSSEGEVVTNSHSRVSCKMRCDLPSLALKATTPLSSSNTETRPVRESMIGSDRVVNPNCTIVPDLCHCESLAKASARDTRMFLWVAERIGFSSARLLSAKFRWQLLPPLPELFAVLKERDRKYTKRGTKTKRLSGSRSSLKKRSSAG